MGLPPTASRPGHPGGGGHAGASGVFGGVVNGNFSGVGDTEFGGKSL